MPGEYLNPGAESVARHLLSPIVDFIALCLLAVVLLLGAIWLLWRAATRGLRAEVEEKKRQARREFLFRMWGWDAHNGFIDVPHRASYRAAIRRYYDERTDGKTKAGCAARFANTANFGGFPGARMIDIGVKQIRLTEPDVTGVGVDNA